MHVRYLIPLAILMIAGSTATGSETTMDEKKIEAYGAYSADYVRRGKPSVHVDIDAPVVIAVADQEYKWGFFQFPSIARWADGSIAVKYNMTTDAAESYGLPNPTMVSSDVGKTWTAHTDPLGVTGLLLPNGDRIEISTPRPYGLKNLRLPEPVKPGTRLYRLGDLSPKLSTIRISRIAKGSTEPRIEHAALDDPQALRYSLRDVFPIVWWGDMHVVSDGSVIAGIYPGRYVRDDGTIEDKGGVFFYRSTDSGRSWKIQGRITYQPDLKADPIGDKRGGYTEPAYEVLADGSLLCVMRTTDSSVGPMYSSRSKDDGKTWSTPKAFTPNGVLPRLLRLKNGVLVLAAGRPGVQLRFCTDGKGQKWTDPFDIVPITSDSVSADTCGYTGLLTTGPDSFLIVYSHFKHSTESGHRKAILVREVTVKP